MIFLDYSKFYTPVEIADLLIKQLKINPPESVIDICCGSYNLLYSAKKQWPETKLVGVDIIEHAAADIYCVQSDGRKFALEHPTQYSLVLANPPFDNVDVKQEFPDLYNDIPFKYSTSRLENEMFLANLRLLSMDGTLLIIMPNTFINAKSNFEIRKYISNKYQIQKIIRLPDGVFGSSKINCYALIIKNAYNSRKYTKVYDVMVVDSKYTISKPVAVPQKQIKAGIWDTNYISTTLDIGLKCRRGTISSHFFAHSGVPILHTAKMQQKWKPSIRYVAKDTSSAVYAEDGDIIVNRIGKAAGQWYKYTGTPILISDCLYCIKDPNDDVAKRLLGHVFSLPLRGVATRYITMEDFGAWYKSLG